MKNWNLINKFLWQFACINGTSSTRAKILNKAYSPESWSKPARNSVTLVQILSVRQNRFWTSISSSTQGIDDYKPTVVFLLILSNILAGMPQRPLGALESPEISCTPSQDLWEISFLRRTISVQRLARFFGTARRTEILLLYKDKVHLLVNLEIENSALLY